MEKRKPDCYAVQGWVDGFGHDTATYKIFRTRAEAQGYLKENKNNSEEEYGITRGRVVPVYFGEEYKEIYG